MVKMKVQDFVDKAIEVEKLPTLYQLGKFMNSYSNKYLLCDCSGLIKGILWGYPDHGKYGSKGVLDMNADAMIDKCSHVTNDFSQLQKGWLVWMKGHIGIYIEHGIVIESTPIWENGIQKTYCQGCGISNTSHLPQRKWTLCGMLDRYIDYTNNQYKSSQQKVNVYYRVKTKKHGWLPEVKNLEDYAGYQDQPIIAVAMKVSKGQIKYRVHIQNGSWLDWITGYDIHDYQKGYAGNHQVIDAIQIYYETPQDIRPYQRAKYKTNFGWQYDNETSNQQDGYAGLFHHPMTRLSICIE